METLTIRIHLRTKAELERKAAAHNRSRSEYIRTLLEDRHDHGDGDRVRELETRIEELRGDLQHERARADELQGMLKAAHRRNDEVEAVVEYVEGRKGVVGRAKRWLFGRD